MKTADFDYPLPVDLVAQYPAEERDSSRLMVLNRAARTIEHRSFHDISDYFSEGDCLVINETKVIPARLSAKRYPSGGQLEVFLLREQAEGLWEVLVKPGSRAPVDSEVRFGDGSLSGVIIDILDEGKRLVRFEDGLDVNELIERWGEVPLPPYVDRKAEDSDRDRYQTVYARHPGAVAAPTAGLHFTDELLEQVENRGVRIAPVLLHVGLGTFRPVTAEDPTVHRMESEYFEIGDDSVRLINTVKSEKKRIVAVGTTTVKALESAANEKMKLSGTKGWSDIFIYPPFTFRIVDCLITNFHLPKSTLLMLVSAFADREFILEAYHEAIARKYRFYSYGDAMLIL